MEIEDINPDFDIFGPDSSHLSYNTLKFLGLLMGYLLYHEIDKAAELLLTVRYNNRLEEIKTASEKLFQLCDIVTEDRID